MFKSKNKIAVLTLATLSLLAVTAVGFAQRHHLIVLGRPDVQVQVSAPLSAIRNWCFGQDQWQAGCSRLDHRV